MSRNTIDDLITLMAALRDPEGGCPWDREQDFLSIAPYTIEEAYEVADAIARDDMEELRDELGDLLFQVVFHARMAEERGAFAFNEVVEAIVAKMTRRHPHVFGQAEVADAEEQTRAWERLKAEERREKGEHHSLLDGVTLGLPALSRAWKLQKRAARAGFDRSSTERVLDKIEEALRAVRAELEGSDVASLQGQIGDLLFACVNLARHTGVDAEGALRDGNSKFERRFRYLESALRQQGRELEQCSLEEMDRLWEEAKGSG